MKFDLHTHTKFSHGKGYPKDNIEAALSAGLEKIAITDHAPGHKSYGVRQVDEYFENVLKLKREYEGQIEVLAGFEFNILNPQGDTDYFSKYDQYLDIKLVGYHKFAFSNDVKSMSYFMFRAPKEIVKNTDIYVKIAHSKKFDIITHPGYALKIDAKEFAKACAESGTLIEINDKHNSFTSLDLEMAASYGARFILSSDAHVPHAVGKVDTAIAAAKAAGILTAVINL